MCVIHCTCCANMRAYYGCPLSAIIILARIPNPSVFRSPFRSANRSTVSLLFLILPRPSLEVFYRKCFEKNIWNRRGKKEENYENTDTYYYYYYWDLVVIVNMVRNTRWVPECFLSFCDSYFQINPFCLFFLLLLFLLRFSHFHSCACCCISLSPRIQYFSGIKTEFGRSRWIKWMEKKSSGEG